MRSEVFMDRQPEVRWQPVNNGLVDVTLCLNEREVTVENEGQEGTSMKMWEYDFYLFREKVSLIDEEEIRAAPEAWMDYQPQKDQTVDEKLQAMQLNNDMAFAEMSLLIAQLMM